MESFDAESNTDEISCSFIQTCRHIEA